MRLVYLASCRRGLLWWRHYYERAFPEGAANARARIIATERLLLDNPYIGRPTHRPGVRRLALPRTPFFLIYRVTPERIEIIRVIDSRSYDSMLLD
jgi:plasmid stabilization system protein ParE